MPLSWAERRKLSYKLILAFVFLGVAAYFSYPYFSKPSTCFDGKRNQDEAGTDCGGSCAAVCVDEIKPPVTIWSGVFPSANGRYSAVAFVENRNADAGTRAARYNFRIYDESNIIIAERKGETFIAPGESFTLIEPNIDAGRRIPRRAFFEFLSFSEWETIDPPERPLIFIRDQKLSNDDSHTRLDARLESAMIIPVSDIAVAALLYDEKGNAITVSSTIVPTLAGQSSRPIVFTWPKMELSNIARAEIIPRFNVFENI